MLPQRLRETRPAAPHTPLVQPKPLLPRASFAAILDGNWETYTAVEQPSTFLP